MNKHDEYFNLKSLTARRYYLRLRRHNRNLDKSLQEPAGLGITEITWQE
jgi:hypothetical protein